MLCRNCGSKLFEGNVFCEHCGQKINESAEKQETSQPIALPIKAERDKAKTKKVMIVALAALLLVGLIVGAVLVFGGAGSAENEAGLDSAEEEVILATHTIRLHLNFAGAEDAPPLVIAEGTTIAELPIPKRPGYTFTNWTSDRAGQNVLSPGALITGDSTLYAQWKVAATQIFDQLAEISAIEGYQEFLAQLQASNLAAMFAESSNSLTFPLFFDTSDGRIGIYQTDEGFMVYQGDFVGDSREGFGRWFSLDGWYFSEGQWNGDMPNGQFSKQFGNAQRTGEVVGGLWHGDVVWTHLDSGNSFVLQFVMGRVVVIETNYNVTHTAPYMVGRHVSESNHTYWWTDSLVSVVHGLRSFADAG